MKNRIFFILLIAATFNGHAQQIMSGEYFFDTEPGLGNGLSLEIESPADSIEQNFVIPLGNLGPGFHNLFVRVQDQFGTWSLADQRSLYIIQGDAIDADIVSGEFFVDVEPGIGNGTFFTISTPSADIETDISLTIPELDLGSHILYIRLRNGEGNWTLIEPRPFTVCETYGAVSQFELQENGNMIVLQNQSQFADSFIWNFGDGITSELNDPIHFFSESGIYNVSLYTFNDCGIDTLTQTVTVEGVESVAPNSVSSSSVSTLTITGFGFVDGTTMKLTKEGYDDIIPFNTIVANSMHLISVVNFSSQPLGYWNVEVEIPGEGIFVLQDALEIINVPVTNTNILMSSTQIGACRTGRKMPAIMHIQNENYADVLALPVVFRDITGVEQLVLGAQAPITQVPFFAETYQYLLDNSISNTVMEINVAENSTNSQLTGLMIPKVISSASYDVPFFIRRTIDGTHKRGSLMIFPQITAASQLGTIEYQNDLCLSSFIKVATETAYNVSMDDAEWTTCYEFWQDDLFTAIAEVAANDSISQLPISLPACISALLTHMKASDCIGNLPSLTSEGLKFIASHVMANLVFLNDASGVTPSCPQLQGMQLDPHQTEISNTDRENEFCELAQSVGGSSMLSFGGRANQWCALFGSGIDPNTKYGPGNNEDDIYINPGDIVTYDITFENDSNATASVEILNVLDTLDAGKFVLNSFRWGPIALGDSIYIQPDSEELQQVILHDLRPALPYFLLCELNFDTASAVISWNFATLDTLNLQPLDLVLDGFLPPNGNGNEGSGDLIFFIQLNPELTTGDSIQNKAHIIFDFNAEIVTPYWTNVIDNEPPQSEVLDLPVNIGEETFLISWSGVDNPAGIDSYTIYVSKDDGPFLPWIVMTDTLSSYFIGQYGSTYKFYSNAIDNAGNWELSPEDPWNNYDAITQLVDNIEEIAGNAQFFLYPNPADNAISVHLLLQENAMMRTEWINILGESIQVDGNIDSQVKVSAGSSTRTFDISLLSPGMYFLKLYINEQAASLRFIRK